MIPTKIVIHHTATNPDTTIHQINEWHKQRGFPESSLGSHIGYHFVIPPDGTIYQPRRENEIGAHSVPNDGKIGICLIGNFGITEPKTQQLDALIELVNALKKTYNITDVMGHRECNPTECPGDNLQKYVVKLKEINRLQRLIRFFLKFLPHV